MTKFFTLTVAPILTVVLILAACKNSDNNSNDKNNGDNLVTTKTTDILIYKIGLPFHDTLDLFPETVIKIKKATDKPTFLQFTAGGTVTDISIIDSAFADNYINVSVCPPTKALRFGHDESGLLDISNLENGTFYIQYSSCNLGGSYRMYLTE